MKATRWQGLWYYKAMPLSKTKIIIIFSTAIIVAVFVLIFLGILPGMKPEPSGGGGGIGGKKKTQISFWGVENANYIKTLTDAYSAANPTFQINYQQFDESTYEKTLINALAAGQGPDLFMFNNLWLKKHSDKIISAPDSQFSITQIRQLYPTIVEQNFTASGKIYALPLYIDTLALIYNKDYFDTKGVAVMPNTWQQFQTLIPKLTTLDQNNKITKSAAAIGGSEKSVSNASDLLNLIMLQFGAEMLNQYGEANFNDEQGKQAFNFYLQFSDPSNKYYTWNDSLRYSLDNFSQGNTAAIFNYSSSIASLKAKNPFLNIAVAPMLQFNENSPINWTDYWGVAVSNQSKNQLAGWNFIIKTLASQQIAENYLQSSRRPPALRALIQKYINDPELGVFANQTLTARAWPQSDNNTIKRIFSNMIDSVINKGLTADKALQRAEEEANNL